MPWSFLRASCPLLCCGVVVRCGAVQLQLQAAPLVACRGHVRGSALSSFTTQTSRQREEGRRGDQQHACGETDPPLHASLPLPPPHVCACLFSRAPVAEWVESSRCWLLRCPRVAAAAPLHTTTTTTHAAHTATRRIEHTCDARYLVRVCIGTREEDHPIRTAAVGGRLEVAAGCVAQLLLRHGEKTEAAEPDANYNEESEEDSH